VYSIPAPLTSSPKQFSSGAASLLRIQGMSSCSVILVLIKGTEQPVSSRTRTTCWVGPHEMIMVVIGLLPHCGLFVDFSGEALLGFSLLCCLSCEVPALGSSGPFRFRFVPQIIGKDLGCSEPRPSKNPSRLARLTAASRPRLPVCPRPRSCHGRF